MGKVKTTQVKGDEAEKIVLEYLRKQNRPYSATDISCNLHNSVTKASAAKVLALLEKQGEIAVKTYGKQSVYVIKQDPLDTASPQELEEMDEKIQTLKTEIAQAKNRIKALTSSLAALMGTQTTQELGANMPVLKQETDELEARLSSLRSGSVRLITPEERTRIDKEYVFMRKTWRARKRMFADLWFALTENLEHDGELRAMLGIEDDEEAMGDDLVVESKPGK